MATFAVTNVETIDTGVPVQPSGGGTGAATTATTTVMSKVTGSAGTPGPTTWVVLVSVAMFAIFAIAAWLVFKGQDTPTYFKVGSDYTALAALVLAAGAVERFLEPFSSWLLPKDAAEADAAKKKNDAGEKAANPTSSGVAVQAAVNVAAAAQANLDGRRADRAILYWALASSVALVAPVGLGVFFLRAVAASGSEPNRFLDMVFTALVVGAGTKPLHDTIEGIQKKKEAAEDQAATTS